MKHIIIVALFCLSASCVLASSDMCSEKYEGEWFTIQHPLGFIPHQIEVAGGEVNTVWFKSAVDNLDLYIHSPEWGGFDLASQLSVDEELLSSDSQLDNNLTLTFLAIRDVSNHIRNLKVTSNMNGSARWVIGFRTKTGLLNPRQEQQYACFKQSLKQFMSH